MKRNKKFAHRKRARKILAKNWGLFQLKRQREKWIQIRETKQNYREICLKIKKW